MKLRIRGKIPVPEELEYLVGKGCKKSSFSVCHWAGRVGQKNLVTKILLLVVVPSYSGQSQPMPGLNNINNSTQMLFLH